MRYHPVSAALHWLMALGVAAQIGLGLWMLTIPKAPPGVRAYWFNVHKSIGITLGLLVIVRLLWRWMHKPPALPGVMPAWQQRAAAVSHSLLYSCLLVMPLSGYLGSSFTKYPIKYFGYTLPHWGWDAPQLKALCSDVHAYTAALFGVLIVVHVAAALKHRFIDRDDIFQRMSLRGGGQG